MNEFIKVALKADATNLEKGFAAGTAAVNGFKRAVSEVNSRIDRADQALKSMGHKFLGAAAGFGAAMYASVKAAEGFEVQMRNVNSIVQESEAGFSRMSQQVVNLSTRLPQSAENLGAGLYDIASSGFQGADAMNVLEQSAIAATAGMTDTAVASKGITAILNAYGLSASKAADVSDILFQTVNVGVLSFDELVQQLGDFVPIGKAAGIQFETMAAAVAALTRNGFPAAQAATSLTGVIRGFIKPSKEMTDQVKKMGYESALTMLQQEGLQGSLTKLNNAVGGNAGAWGQLIQDTEGLRGALSLLSNDGKVFTESLNSIGSEAARAGAAQKAYAEQSKSTEAQITLFKNSITALRIEIGEYYLPIINRLLNMSSLLVSGLNSIPGPFKAIIAFGTLASTVLASLGAYFLILRARGALINAVIGRSATAVRLFGKDTRSVTGALVNFGKVMTTGAETAARAGQAQAAFGRTVNKVVPPLRGATGAVERLGVRLATTGRGQYAFGSGSNALARNAAAMNQRLSTSDTILGRMGRNLTNTAGRFRLAAGAADRMKTAIGGLKNHMGQIASALFVGIGLIQQWKDTAEGAKATVKGLVDEEGAKHDMSTLSGMEQSYDALYKKLQDLNDLGETGQGFQGGLPGDVNDIKGGLQSFGAMFGVVDDKIAQHRRQIEALSDQLNGMREQYASAKRGLTDLSDASGKSTDDLEKIAKAAEIDITQLRGLSDQGMLNTKTELQLYKAHMITRDQLQKYADTTGDTTIKLYLAATATSSFEDHASALERQLHTLQSTARGTADAVVELTDAQKILKQASESVGSASTAFSTALNNLRTDAQKAADDEISAMNKQADARDKAMEDASEARVKAAEDEVSHYKSGTKRARLAQESLDALRDQEQNSLEQHRQAQKDTLDKQTKDIQDAVQKQELSLEDYTAALMWQNATLENYQRNVVTLTAQLASQFKPEDAKKIVTYLAGLGDDGKKIIEQMVSGSTDQTKTMGDEILRNIKDTSDQTAVELDAGMSTAAEAGAAGAKATRDGILKTLGLLPSDAANVMEKFGKAIEDGLNTILEGTGQDPIHFDFNAHHDTREKEYVSGGVRRRAKGGYDSQAMIARNPTVLFGERGTGGEAFIPLGGDRARNVSIWAETGRRLGVIPMASGGFIPATMPQLIKQSVDRSHSETHRIDFTGDMYLADAEAVIRYAERQRRLNKLRGMRGSN